MFVFLHSFTEPEMSYDDVSTSFLGFNSQIQILPVLDEIFHAEIALTSAFNTIIRTHSALDASRSFRTAANTGFSLNDCSMSSSEDCELLTASLN